MNSNSFRKFLNAPQTKKTVVMALLVAVTLSTVPVKEAFADVASATSSVAGTDGTGDDKPNPRPAPVLLTKDPGITVAPTSTRIVVVRKYAGVPMTAYTSRPEETDDSPFITADGSRVRDGIVAANFLPFGTKVRIPKLFGDKIFEVHDRMNKRYPYKMDFWMEELKAARQFGVRRADIEIVKIEVVPAKVVTAATSIVKN